MVETRVFNKPAGRRPAGKWSGGKFAPKRKVCIFCANRSKSIDYKDTALLGRFISDRGKIEPCRRTGTCNRHQHALALAIKQARHVALLPFVPEHIHLQGIVPPLNLNPVPQPTENLNTQVEMVETVEAVKEETVVDVEPVATIEETVADVEAVAVPEEVVDNVEVMPATEEEITTETQLPNDQTDA